MAAALRLPRGIGVGAATPADTASRSLWRGSLRAPPEAPRRWSVTAVSAGDAKECGVQGTPPRLSEGGENLATPARRKGT